MNPESPSKSTQALPAWLGGAELPLQAVQKPAFARQTARSLAAMLLKLRQTRQDHSRTSTSVPGRRGGLGILGAALFLLTLSLVSHPGTCLALGTLVMAALSLQPTKRLKAGLTLALVMGGMTTLICLPLLLWGSADTTVPLLCLKSAMSGAVVGMVSSGMGGAELIHGLNWLRLPRLFLQVTDLAIRYLIILGEQALDLITALELRGAQGKRGRQALGGIGGTLFLGSRKAAGELYQAMVCRGYDGSYPRPTLKVPAATQEHP